MDKVLNRPADKPNRGAAQSASSSATAATTDAPVSAGHEQPSAATSTAPPPPPRGLTRVLGLPGDPNRTKRLANILGVFLLVDAIIAGVAIALLSGGSDSTRQVQPAAKLPTGAASVSVSPTALLSAPVAWVKSALPGSAVVLTDVNMRLQLARAGVQTVVNPTATTAATVQYVLSTPVLRASAKTNRSAATLLATSAPVAAFGSGSSKIVVQEVTGISAGQLATDRGIDGSRRKDAEQQLLSNRNLKTGKGVAAILQAGSLDMRAATVIALLANAGPTQLQSVAVDPAETAAGVPARRILVTAESRTAVAGILDNLPQAYRPMSVTELAGGAQRLVWPLQPDPITG